MNDRLYRLNNFVVAFAKRIERRIFPASNTEADRLAAKPWVAWINKVSTPDAWKLCHLGTHEWGPLRINPKRCAVQFF